ncbi:hypothetical protein ABIE41_001465 [Bosea sp. OAE506]
MNALRRALFLAATVSAIALAFRFNPFLAFWTP